MGWEDTDGDGHKELNGDVGPVAHGVSTYYAVAAAGLATAAGVAGATGVGAPVAVPLIVAAGGATVVAAGANSVSYFADRYDWKYKIEPGQVIEDTGEAIDSAKDKAGALWEGAKDKADDVKDRLRDLNPFGSDGPPSPGGSFVNTVGGQASGMRRLDEAFARLQSLL